MKPKVCSLALLLEGNKIDVKTLKTQATNEHAWHWADTAVGRLVHQKCTVRIPAVYVCSFSFLVAFLRPLRGKFRIYEGPSYHFYSHNQLSGTLSSISSQQHPATIKKNVHTRPNKESINKSLSWPSSIQFFFSFTKEPFQNILTQYKSLSFMLSRVHFNIIQLWMCLTDTVSSGEVFQPPLYDSPCCCITPSNKHTTNVRRSQDVLRR